ncbi:MAG TPA: TauD/TfdA family dioxygenase [Alphaproteobacteria bacterium]
MLTYSPPASVTIPQGRTLVVAWSDGRESRFPAIWLADNRPENRHKPDGQRLADAAELPAEIAIRRAAIGPGGIEVAFSCFEAPSTFDAAWLRAHALDPASCAERRHEPLIWDRRLADDLPAETYEAATKDRAALARWLTHVRDLGFAMLRGVPAKAGQVCEVVGLFGYVRETNYGRLFDVIATEDADNLAYTALQLGNHTDNPYRDPVPQLQLLHCLEAAAGGGESVVVDGFAAAERLKHEDPRAFEILTRTAVPFRYFEAGAVDLRHRAPLIELDIEGRVRTIRYNNRSMAPLDLDAEDVPAFYAAYRHFARLLHDPSLTVGFCLGPGDLFIVDNRRVLHGRRGFSGGRRHLQGTYADTDSLLSKLRILEQLG